jgi:hypothetical protein
MKHLEPVRRSAHKTASRITKLLAPALALFALAMPASAATNLVKNGSFESNGGPGATEYGTYRITLDDWFISPRGFMGLDTEANAKTNVGPEPILLWGASPDYPSDNGFTGSPDGGYFWVADGHPGFRGYLQQDITGLTVGEIYDLSFYYAHAQEGCGPCNGDTRQAWHVYLGNDLLLQTDFIDVPPHGFKGWYKATQSFTASAITQTLQFWADGGNGAPPMALLDGVKVMAQNEPLTPTPGPLPLMGFGVSLAWSNRLRKRIKQSNSH